MVDTHSDDETVVLSREAIEQMHGRPLAPEKAQDLDEEEEKPQVDDTCKIKVQLEDAGWLS